MSDDNLTGKEAALLVLLLAENRPITNSELQHDHGFELKKDAREKLNDLGYIRSTKSGRQPFTHELTDDGWARCYKPLNLESPKARAQGAALQALLQAVLRHLDRSDLSLADFAGGPDTSSDQPPGAAPEPDLAAAPVPEAVTSEAGAPRETTAPSPQDAVPRPVATPDRIRQTYLRLGQRLGAWVGLAELRAALADIDRAELDRALRELERQPGVTIVPESNQKTLTAADREAALWIGGEYKHFLAIGA